MQKNYKMIYISKKNKCLNASKLIQKLYSDIYINRFNKVLNCKIEKN